MVVCITLLFALLGFTSFGDTSCEVYKTQVINDCDVCINTVRSIKDELSYIKADAERGVGESSATSNAWYNMMFRGIVVNAQSSFARAESLEDSILSIQQTARELQCNSSSDGSCDCAEVLGDISAQLSTISDKLVAQGSKVDTINTRLNSIITITTTIRDKVSNVDSNVGNMSTVLSDIKGYIESQSEVLQSILGDNYDKGVQGILANAEGGVEWLEDIYDFVAKFEEPITETAAQLYQICEYFDNYLQQAFPLWLELLQKLDPEKVSSLIDNLTWFIGRNGDSDTTAKSFQDLYSIVSVLGNQITNVFANTGLTASPISSIYTLKSYNGQPSISPLSTWIAPFHSYMSANTMRGYTLKNTLFYGFKSQVGLLSSLNNYAYADYISMGVLTNLVASGFSSITNTLVDQFSIFANDSPLKGTTEKPDKYYDYLTNYYIKVSVNPSGSASEPYTNWFNRIEMLLAALVFKTDKPVSNNFTTANTESMRGALDSALDNVRGIQDNSQSVITTVEKSSRSLLNVISQWDDKLTMASSLPSHIDFIDIGGAKDGGGAKRASSDPGLGGAVNTKIGLDLSSGPLKLFLDSCRAVSTLCWIFVFIFAGWGVACFMVSKFLTVIKFCYAVFKVALGLG